MTLTILQSRYKTTNKNVTLKNVNDHVTLTQALARFSIPVTVLAFVVPPQALGARPLVLAVAADDVGIARVARLVAAVLEAGARTHTVPARADTRLATCNVRRFLKGSEKFTILTYMCILYWLCIVTVHKLRSLINN